MRNAIILTAAAIALAACGKSNSQADQLDNAAKQSDPAAAAELHNQADAIRDNGADANISDPNSPAQNALEAAGNAAASNTSASAQPGKTSVYPQTGLTHKP